MDNLKGKIIAVYGSVVDVQFEVDGQRRHMRRFLTIPVGGGI